MSYFGKIVCVAILITVMLGLFGCASIEYKQGYQNREFYSERFNVNVLISNGFRIISTAATGSNKLDEAYIFRKDLALGENSNAIIILFCDTLSQSRSRTGKWYLGSNPLLFDDRPVIDHGQTKFQNRDYYYAVKFYNVIEKGSWLDKAFSQDADRHSTMCISKEYRRLISGQYYFTILYAENLDGGHAPDGLSWSNPNLLTAEQLSFVADFVKRANESFEVLEYNSHPHQKSIVSARESLKEVKPDSVEEGSLTSSFYGRVYTNSEKGFQITLPQGSKTTDEIEKADILSFISKDVYFNVNAWHQPEGLADFDTTSLFDKLLCLIVDPALELTVLTSEEARFCERNARILTYKASLPRHPCTFGKCYILSNGSHLFLLDFMVKDTYCMPAREQFKQKEVYADEVLESFLFID
ncbi:hypothetical protein [Desulfatibacillum aliphaticivorans]|uniref:hypothetical protein n=1 Tax=Desulfatibacillum aliphaticivorans TaxID=218208 RepID=UPI0003FDDB35|nr:hypothetical protein [Desulfatibacillum aliphaticivorans]